MAWLPEKSMPRTYFIVFRERRFHRSNGQHRCDEGEVARPIEATEGGVKRNTDGTGQKARFPANARLPLVPQISFCPCLPGDLCNFERLDR
jgi:hypothetical protein